MYQFIIMLRAIACLLITNSHQEEIYPIRILASGGLLGDVIYFSISGYLLYSIAQQSFGKWYFKRLKRVYPPVWLTAGTLILTGVYGVVTAKRVLNLMFYPTHYHFVASILVLYIFFFFLMKFINQKPGDEEKRLKYVVIGTVVLYFVLFYTVYDHSYYHIDDVNNKMIWPLYFLAMIIGLWFRRHEKAYLGRGGILPWILTVICAIAYFATKFTLSRNILPASIQWINQFTLLMLLVGIFRCFIGFEDVIKRLPSSVTAPFRFIADMAFELYLAQAVIIPTFNTGKETFPYNLLVTISITFLFAWLVHIATNIIFNWQECYTKRCLSRRRCRNENSFGCYRPKSYMPISPATCEYAA